MSVAIFMLIFWPGFRRFDLQRELESVGKREWARIEKRERPAKWQMRDV